MIVKPAVFKTERARLFVPALLLVGGVGLIALAFLVDIAGFSEPGFGVSQKQMVVIGGAAVFLGVAMLFAGDRIRDELLGAGSAEAQAEALVSRADVAMGAAAFTLAFLAAVFYFHAAQAGDSSLFYAATVAQSSGLAGLAFTYGFLYGTVAALSYALFRLGMGRFLAGLASLALVMSPVHLHNLIPSIFRDYLKAPFILAVFLIMGLLVVRPYQRNLVFALAALGGVVIGVGAWFRPDVLIAAPPFGVTLIFFLPGSIKDGLKERLIAAGIFMVTVAWFSLPMLTSPSIGPMNALSGFMAPNNARLGVTDTAYDWGYLKTDEFVMANSYAQAEAAAPQGRFTFAQPEYLRVASKNIRLIVTNFPADMLARTYASVSKVLELPFAYQQPPFAVSNHLIRLIYSWRSVLIGLLGGAGLILTVICLLIICARSLRQAIFCFLFLVYFAGYPVLQFQGRHYFHLEFIGLWSLGFLAQALVSSAGWLKRGQWQQDVPWLRVAVFTLGSSVLVFGSLAAARAYQSKRVEHIVKSYTEAEVESLPLLKLPAGKGKVLVTSPRLAKPPKGALAVDFLAAEFVRKDGQPTVWPTLWYEKKTKGPGRPGFSRALQIELPRHGARRVFFPAINYRSSMLGGTTRFKGIMLSAAEAGTLKTLKRIKDTSALPMLLTITIPPSGGRSALAQHITRWEREGLYTVPEVPKLEADSLLQRPYRPLTSRDVVFKAAIVRLNGRGLVVSGYANPQRDPYNRPILDRSRSRLAGVIGGAVSVGVIDTDLLFTRPVKLKQGAYFIASGVCRIGGVTFGLVSDGQMAGQVSVTSPGPFRVVIKVPRSGNYSLGMANNLDGYTSLENRLTVDRLGWVD